MTQHYKYRLGVDLGIASIGVALVQIDGAGSPRKILDMGVRIFSTPEGAAERRTKRLERKHIRRKRQRLAKVRQVLQEYGLLPTDPASLKLLIRKEPYRLRAMAAVDRVTQMEDLGRCFLHMAKFRGAGFLTQQEEASEDRAQAFGEEDENAPNAQDRQKTASAYRFLEKLVRERKQTLAQFFAGRLEKRLPVRRRKLLVDTKQIEHAVPRFLVKEEFRRIWAMQSGFYPSLTKELEQTVYKAIFDDAPHAPYAVGNCALEPKDKRLPRMHRLAEKRRIYEQINNIRYATPEGECFPSRELRDHLVALAYGQGKNLSKTLLKKEIASATGQKILHVNLHDEETSIKGFCHVAAFSDISAWGAMTEAEQDAVIDFIAEPAINPSDPASELYPEDEFLKKLCAMLHLEGPDAASEASRAISRLAKDRSNLGVTATVRILDQLIAGYEAEVYVVGGQTQTIWRAHTHRTAADACGFTAEEERIRTLQGTYSFLPYYGEILRHDVTPVHPWHKNNTAPEEAGGRIPNPVVHVALNQLRKIINEIISLYGKPESIHVEFARELGMSAAKREERIKEIQKNERENERINKELLALGLRPGRNNRIKYKLWEEQGKRSLYSYKEIQASDIGVCEIDHLIPQSQGGTDSMMNLCLCFEDENKAKGDMFPYTMIQKHAPEKWKEISKILTDRNFPKKKAWRFQSDAATRYGLHGDEDQTDNRLTDTSYMAKMGARYLRALCADVVAVKGGTTAYLRHLWGLDGLEYELFSLPVNKEVIDQQTGEVLRNPLWASKPRIDHRHHALDALVAACTTRSMVTLLVREEKSGRRQADFPVPFGGCAADFREQTLQALRRVLPSRKAEHGKAGQLHDATKYRILQPKNPAQPSEGDYLIRYRRSLNHIANKNAVTNIIFNTSTIPLDNQAAQTAFHQCKTIINTIERKYPSAEQALYVAQQEAAQSGRLNRTITDKAKEEAVVRKAIQLAQGEGKLGASYPCLDYKRLVAVNRRLQFGYEPRSNYCMDFYETPDGKVGWECITRIEASDSGFAPKWKQAGGRHIWSLCIGDVIEVTPTGAFRRDLGSLCSADGVYLVVQKMSEGRLQCNLLHDARSLDGKSPAIKAGLTKEEAYTRWATGEKGLKNYCELAARKVDISPFGKILRKHKRLWSGGKTASKS